MTDDTQPTTPFDEVIDGTQRPVRSATELIPPAAPPAPTPPPAPDASLSPVASDSSVASAPLPKPLPKPRVRWGAIIWGLVFAAVAATVLWIVLDPALRDDVSAWWFALSPGSMLLAALVVLGAVLLIAGVAGLARRASRPRHDEEPQVDQVRRHHQRSLQS